MEHLKNLEKVLLTLNENKVQYPHSIKIQDEEITIHCTIKHHVYLVNVKACWMDEYDIQDNDELVSLCNYLKKLQ